MIYNYTHRFHLPLLLLELVHLGQLVSVKPLDCFVTLLHNLLLVLLTDLVLQVIVLESGLHVKAVGLKTILGGNFLLLLLIISLKILCIRDHLLYFLLGQTALVIGDGDLVELSGGLVTRAYVQDAIGVDVKGDLDLRHAPGRGRDAGQVELAEEVVVLGHGALALVHLDGDGGLVVAVGGEGLGLLGGDGGVPLDEAGHHAARGLDTQGQRRHVQQQQVRHGLGGVAGEDGGLHRGAVRHGLVRVDGLVQLLAVEEVLQQLLDLGDPGGASDQHDVVDGALVHLGIPHGLLHWLQRALEQVAAELLEPGPGDGGVEVDALKQGVDLNVGLGGGG